ncbi:hypothetical protein GCM10009696_00660 [Kocuria himachalensis]
MGLGDKISAAADKTTGAAKEKVGAATDNPDLQAQGQAQNIAGHAKQAGESVEDAAMNAADDPR